MLTYEAETAAPAHVAWALIARPARWHEWSPHIRGAWRLGEPEVAEGARGFARLLGVVPIPAAVTAKEDGRSWTWRVGWVLPIDLVHRVRARGDGTSVVAIDIVAPGPLEAVLALTYGPVVSLLVDHLARVAAREAS